MTSNKETLKVIALEDGSSAVVKVDLANPRLWEVVATFFDAARAQQYAKLTEGERREPEAEVTESELPARTARVV